MISKILLLLGLAFAQNSTYIKGPTLYESLTTVVSSGGNLGLTCSSNTNLELTGTLTHTFTLPDATTCALGRVFEIQNNSTLTLTVRTFGGVFFKGVPSGGFLRVVLKTNGTSAGTWQYAQGVYPISISRDVITNFAAGSIPFSDGVTLSQNNSSFFWDNVNNRLGIGTNVPTASLEVRDPTNPLLRLNGDGATFTVPPPNTVMHTVGNNGATSRIVFDSHNSGVNGSYLLGRHARGTATAPTNVLSGDTLMGFAGIGYGATGYPSNGSGYMLIRASENFTDTANGTNIQFHTTPTGSITPLLGMTLSAAQNLRVEGNTSSLTETAIRGATSGTVSVRAQSVAGTYNFNLPTSAGTANQLLTSQGGGATAMTFQSLSSLPGSITTNGTTTERQERMRFTGASGGVCTVSNESGDWINGNGTSSGAGFCSFNFIASFFSSAPVCVVSQNSAAGPTLCRLEGNPSTSGFTTYCYNSTTGAASNQDGNVICMGPK